MYFVVWHAAKQANTKPISNGKQIDDFIAMQIIPEWINKTVLSLRWSGCLQEL